MSAKKFSEFVVKEITSHVEQKDRRLDYLEEQIRKRDVIMRNLETWNHHYARCKMCNTSGLMKWINYKNTKFCMTCALYRDFENYVNYQE